MDLSEHVNTNKWTIGKH